MKLPRVLFGVALALFVAVTGTACATHAGVAAQVGSQSIETSALREIVDDGVAAVEASQAEGVVQVVDRPALQRPILTYMVRHLLLAGQAQRLGLSVSEQEVDSYYQAYGIIIAGTVENFERQQASQGFTPEYLRTVISSFALEVAIQQKVFPGLRADDADVQAEYDAVVAHFGEIPLTFEQARPYISSILLGEKRFKRLRPLLREAAARAGVSVNPRFGRWDQEQFAVVAADGSIATTTAPEPLFDPTRPS